MATKKKYKRRPPAAVREARSEPLEFTLIDRRNPLQSLPPAEREAVAQLAKPGRQKIHLPQGWRQLVATICSRPWTQPVLAQALGFSVDTLRARLKDTPALSDLIARCDAHFIQRLTQPVVDRALSGDVQCAQYLLSRLDPTRFGNTPNVQINNNTQVNNTAPAPVPPAMTAEEYTRLLAAAPQAALPAPTQPAVIDAEVVPVESQS